MVMRSALLEMRHSGSCPWWTPKEMTCLIRLVFLQYFPLYIKYAACVGYSLHSLFFYIFRPWPQIKVMSGLPNTTDRKLLRDIKRGLLGKLLTSSFDDEFLYTAVGV